MARRLTLVIHSLDGGGAERIMALMARRWAEMGHAVTLVTLDSVENDRYPLAPAVRRIGLEQMSVSRSKLQGLWNNVTRVRLLRRAIGEARGDQVISFTDKMNVLTLLACPKSSVIICERVDPRHHSIGRLWSQLRRYTYPRCRALVVQTDGVRAYMQRIVKNRPIYVIPNPVTPTEVSSRRERVVVAMGRLVPQKGFDLLIDAFAMIAAQHPDWRLMIYGEGPARASLESQIRKRNLQGAVQIAGWTTDPTQVLSTAGVFALSSRYEGFPNVLLEAMATGVAAVSFDCESGPREIMRHEVDGLLVPPQNVELLAAALDRLLSNDEERVRLGERACEVSERFSDEKFFEAWEQLLRFPDNAKSGV